MKKLEWTVIDRKRKGGGRGGAKGFRLVLFMKGLKILYWNVQMTLTRGK